MEETIDRAAKLKAYKAAWSKAWRAANPEKAKQQDAEQYRKNRERVIARVRLWQEEHKATARAAHAAWLAANREQQKQYSRLHRAKNLRRHAIAQSNRRARIAASEGHHTAEDVTKLLKMQRGKCANPVCRRGLKHGYHVDHIMPLSRGGSNSRRNIQLLCEPCNLRKKDKHPIDFAQQNGLLL